MALSRDQRNEIHEMMELRFGAEISTLQQTNKKLELELAKLKTAHAIDPQDLLDKLSNLRVTAVTTDIPRPSFNPKKMTAESFLQDCERYFNSLGHTDKTMFMSMTKQLFNDTQKGWYDHQGRHAKDWDEFKKQFADRFDGNCEKEERLYELTTRKQKVHEPTEVFIYEMVQLAKYCFIGLKEEEYVEYAQRALHPSLGMILGTNKRTTVPELVSACGEVTKILHDTQEDYPPMTEEDENNGQDKNRDEEESSATYYNEYNSDEETSNFQQDNTETYDEEENINEPETENCSDSYGKDHKEKYQSSSTFISTNPSGQVVKCQRCSGYGHKLEECPTKERVAMCIWTGESWEISDTNPVTDHQLVDVHSDQSEED